MPWCNIGNIRLATQSRHVYISWKCVKVPKMGTKLYDGRWCGGKDSLNSSPIVAQASLWIPNNMPWCSIGNISVAAQSTHIYISRKWTKVQKMGAKLYDGRWYGGKDRLNSSPIMSKASIWIPKVMPWCNIGNIRLATQSRHIYISWKCEESAKNGGKIIWWSMVWREGQALH